MKLALILLFILQSLTANASDIYRTKLMSVCASLLRNHSSQKDFEDIFLDGKVSRRGGLCGPTCMVNSSFAVERIAGLSIKKNTMERMTILKNLHDNNRANVNMPFGSGGFSWHYPAQFVEFLKHLGLPEPKVDDYEMGSSGGPSTELDLSKLLNILSGKQLANAMPLISVTSFDHSNQHGGHFVMVSGHNTARRRILIIDPNDPWIEQSVTYQIRDNRVVLTRDGPLEYVRNEKHETLLIDYAAVFEF